MAREGIKVVPPTQNLFSLYQAAAEILARDGKAEEAVTLLREGHGRIGDGSSGYKLVESAILIAADLGRLDLAEDFEKSPSQTSLFEIVSRISNDDFSGAASLAETSRHDFPRYVALSVQGAFAALAARQFDVARDLIEKVDVKEDLVEGSTQAWLKAAIELRDGNTQLAQDYLDAFAGRAHAKCECTIESLMGYWEASCQEFGSALSYHFPRIPQEISGFNQTLVRHHYFKRDAGSQSAVIPTEPSCADEAKADGASESQMVSVLAVATEWSSGRGGLSTFNRQLCLALAQAGVKVACVVLEAKAEEIAEAKKQGVTLIEANRGPGLTQEQRLVGKPTGLEGFMPDLLIGHGYITGPAAAAVQANHYPTARRIHFVHMAPDEIEPYKPDREDQAAMRAQERTELEENLCRSATRVVAVGPCLYGRFSTHLAAFPDTPKPLRFDPGFDINKSKQRTPPEGDPWQVLLLGRVEDVTLKGLDIAAAAVAKAAEERTYDLPKLELVIRGAKPNEMDQLHAELLNSVGNGQLNIVVRAFTVFDEMLQADLRRASLVLMPSRAEGFGMVGVEAIIAGTPVLLSAESGLGQLLKEQILPEQASRVVVEMCGDNQQVQDRWAGAIHRMLADREASFRRAAEMRVELAARKTWRNSVESLLAELMA